MRIALFIDLLDPGGAQRVLTALANHWVAEGEEIDIVLLAAVARPFFPLDPRARLHCLDAYAGSAAAASKLFMVLTAVTRLRRWIRANRPDVFISFLDQCNFIACMARRGGSTRLVISERADPERGTLIGRGWSKGVRPVVRLLRNLLYRKADLLVVQTKGLKRDFPVCPRDGIAVVPNSVEPLEDRELGFVLPERFVLCMGRLEPQKRLDLAIDAFSCIAGRYPNLDLVILGEGSLRPALEDLARQKGVAGRVLMPGVVAHPGRAIGRAELFLLTSDYEGFPNALLEAMAKRVASIAADCRYGPCEIIRHGENGWLVPPGDSAAIATAMDGILSDDELRLRLAASAAEVSIRFSPSRIFALWQETLCAREPMRD